MKTRFHEEALEEFADAVAFYRSVDRGLAKRFRTSVGIMVSSIGIQPLLGPIHWNDVRKSVMLDFPYSIFYMQVDAHILIVAVMHTSREPDYWLDRID